MLFERPDGGELAALVSLKLDGKDDDVDEFCELVRSAGPEIVGVLTGTRHKPHSRYFVGTGKLEELRAMVQAECAEVVIFNHALAPSQEKNLEEELQCRVLDRTRLILDIFAQRARTHEGKLQVELAQLQHMSSRLIRGWTHLERQKGGIGLRGPGETQLESDRRMLRDRIRYINGRLAKVRLQRSQGRRARDRAEIPTVALVGYTNAGKSTLFNHLTEAKVYAADQLFATLDPTLRRLVVPDYGPIILSDTVGFIRQLPHRLIEAFRATLEEAVNADLLLIVVDCADPEYKQKIVHVQEVLTEIGAGDVPVLLVFNKIDVAKREPALELDEQGRPSRVWLSAQSGAGMAELSVAIAKCLSDGIVEQTLVLTANQGGIRSELYKMQVVLAERYLDDGGIEIDVRMPVNELTRLMGTTPVAQ